MAEAIQVAGKSSIFLSLPSAYSTLIPVGEQLDDTPVEFQHFHHDVHGDSHGGPQGPPIERQILGAVARVQFRLSKWDPVVRKHLHQIGAFATEGAVADAEVGSLLLLERSLRFIVVPSKDNSPAGGGDDPFFFNFPCCIPSGVVTAGQGTKHSILQFAIEAHRAPAGHASAGVIFDRDTTDYDAHIAV